MTRWFQMRKLSTTKFHTFSRSTTFIFTVCPSELYWFVNQHIWGCTGLWTSYAQRARNFFKFWPQHTHTISWHLDKFRDFWNSFAFFRIKKPPARKMVALLRAHVDRNFVSVHGFGLTLHWKTRISFFESFKSNIRCTRSSNLHFPEKFNISK